MFFNVINSIFNSDLFNKFLNKKRKQVFIVVVYNNCLIVKYIQQKFKKVFLVYISGLLMYKCACILNDFCSY